MYVGALWFGVVDGAIVGDPDFNQNPIIEGNTLIVTCTTNSGATPNIELQVNRQAATGFTSSVSGQMVNFTMESVSRSLQGGQIRCMDRSDSTSSSEVTLTVYCELSSPTEYMVLMYGVYFWVGVCWNVVYSDYRVGGQNRAGNPIFLYELNRWECCIIVGWELVINKIIKSGSQLVALLVNCPMRPMPPGCTALNRTWFYSSDQFAMIMPF